MQSTSSSSATAILTQREWLFISKPQPYLSRSVKRVFMHSVRMILACSGMTRRGLRQPALHRTESFTNETSGIWRHIPITLIKRATSEEIVLRGRTEGLLQSERRLGRNGAQLG